MVLRLLLYSGTAFAAAWLLPGIKLKGILSTLLVCLLLICVNYAAQPALEAMSFDADDANTAVFLFIINTLLVMLADVFIAGFQVRNVVWALIFSILLSLSDWLLRVIV